MVLLLVPREGRVMKALPGHVVDRGLSLARSSVLLALLGNGDALAVVGTPPPTSVIVRVCTWSSLLHFSRFDCSTITLRLCLSVSDN